MDNSSDSRCLEIEHSSTILLVSNWADAIILHRTQLQTMLLRYKVERVNDHQMATT